MLSIDLVFGSSSDDWFYEPLRNRFIERSYTVNLHVFSAHRNILELPRFKDQLSGDLIVAGAGLAAALPGVLAGATTKPVIGVPLDKNLGDPASGDYPGIDAFMAIFSMPTGIPVLTCGVNGSAAILAAVEVIDNINALKTLVAVMDTRDQLFTFYERARSTTTFLSINNRRNFELFCERLTAVGKKLHGCSAAKRE